MATFISKTVEQTRALGEEWGRMAKSGWVVALVGDLGAGKTQLVTGIARGLGVSERVLSPTFTLVHEYRTGRLPLFHLDLYRLETPEQVLGAGLEEYLSRPKGVSVIEWAERWFAPENKGGIPARYRLVRIETLGENERQITYEDFGS